MAKPVFTSPNPDGSGWIVQQGGEVISHHRLKERAVEAGRREAIRDAAEHSIQNLNGQIGRKNSYGPDSDPPKDKNR
jgi:hypothetical protein